MACEIQLSKGYVALVDEEDFERVSQFKWSASPNENTVYAHRRVVKPDGNTTTQSLHRFLLDAPSGLMVDHRDGDGLNNTRSNLRLATNSENGRNVRRSVRNKSGYIGVSWNTAYGKWRAQIKADGKNKHLGLFECPVEAAKARDKAAMELHGEFARLNFPDLAA